MKKIRSLLPASLAAVVTALFVSVVLTSCSSPLNEQETQAQAKQEQDASELTKRDYLALLKTQASHTVSVDELQALVSNALDTTEAGRSLVSSGSVITGVKKLPISSEKRFTALSQGRSVGDTEEDPVELYELTVGNPESDDAAFVLASNDDRIGNILAITEGSIEEADENFVTVLTENLQDYVDSTIAEYNSITEADIEAAFEKAIAEESEGARALSNHFSSIDYTGNWQLYATSSNFSIQKNPLLTTKWGQGSVGTYSSTGKAYNNLVRNTYGNTYVTGCGPTAMAQIVAYHGYIKSTAPNKPASFNTSIMGIWGGTYDFPLLRSYSTITNSSPAAVKGQVAALMYQIGKTTQATYSPYSTTNNIGNTKTAFELFGYSISNYAYATALYETPNSSTITYYTTPATIKSALNSNKPIYTRGGGSNGGHAWVIDGHGSMTSYREYFYNTATGQTTYVTISLNNCLMVHCNLGWDGNSNGWYVYGIFDTDNRTLLGTDYNLNDDSAGSFSENTIILIPQRP